MVNSEPERIRDIVRGKDPLRGLCQERLITPEACDWVKFALDPFHDQQLENLRGYPDVSTEPTVVVKVRQAATVTAPEGLPAGATWDCHMVLSPIDYNPNPFPVACRAEPHGSYTSEGYSNNGSGRCVKTTAEGTFLTHRLDGLVINSVPSAGEQGENMTFTPGHMPQVAGDGYAVQNITLDNYLDFDPTDNGVYRVVFSGFEVVNITAQIYKQGAVTVYEYGNSYEMGASVPDQMLFRQATGEHIQGISNPTTYFRCPPNTIAEAKIMPGSHSWAAQDGCYNTAKFQTENPFQALTKRNWIVCQNNDVAAENSGYSTPAPFGSTGTAYSAGSFASDKWLTTVHNDEHFPASDVTGPSHFSRMNTSGAYFTGLSAETSLFVTWRVGIERLPAANKPAFLALSQPSAAYDPNALVLYNLVANILPPGCPQGYNDAGKWFNWIADAAKRSIPTVYPIVRTASMLAASMGRPVLASALTGLAGQMEPVAKKQAAARLQAAARAKNARRTTQKMAVQNWSKGRGAPGGTNGLR